MPARNKTQAIEQTELPQQTGPVIVDERPVPTALRTVVTNANTQLQTMQRQLMQEVTDSAREIMQLMGLAQEEGWLFDVEGLRFVRVQQTQE